MSKYAIEQCIINILGANDKHGITFFRLKAAIHKNQKCQKSNLQQIGCVKWEQTSNRLMWQKCFGVVKSIIEYRKNVIVNSPKMFEENWLMILFHLYLTSCIHLQIELPSKKGEGCTKFLENIAMKWDFSIWFPCVSATTNPLNQMKFYFYEDYLRLCVFVIRYLLCGLRNPYVPKSSYFIWSKVSG